MDRAAALDALPAPYALALTLHDDGADDATIGRRTGVPVDAIPALLEVGEAKLAALLAADGPPDATGSELGM